MRHMARKLKKRKPLLTFTNTKLLHSKSTYFYKQRWNSYLVPTVCASAFLLMVGLVINPSASEHGVYADDGISLTSVEYGQPTMSLNITKAPGDATVADVGGTAYRSYLVNYVASNMDNFSLYLSADSEESLDLVSEDKTTILTGVSSAKGAALPDNTWGYAWTSDLEDTIEKNDQLTFYGLRTLDNVGSSSAYGRLAFSKNDVDLTRRLVFAAKFGEGAAPGHYTSNVTLSLVAKPLTIVTERIGFAELTQMQDMTTSACQLASIGDTKRLVDSRDNKAYWVARLDDGNCWMTQNLDLNLDINKTLTPSDTDIKMNWTPPVSTSTTLPTNFSNNMSYDPGMYVYTTPAEFNSCGASASSIREDGLSACADGRWIDVSSMNPLNSVNSSIVVSQNTYNAHYLAGNYYSFDSAVAGAEYSLDSLSIDSSICPRGWRLPKTGDYQYFIDNTKNSETGRSIFMFPYYFVMSGYGSLGTLNGVGDGAYYFVLDPSIYSGDLLRFTYFMAGSGVWFGLFSGGADTMRGYEYPVRCIAR